MGRISMLRKMFRQVFNKQRTDGAPRVLMVFIGQEYSGGSWTHIKNLKKGLEKQDIIVSIISLNNLWKPLLLLFISGPAHLLQKISRGAGTLYDYKMRKIFLFIRLFYEFLFSRYEAVNAEDVMSASVLTHFKRYFRFKLLLTVHGDLVNECLSDKRLKRDSWPEQLLLREEAYAYNHADAIVAVDTRLKDHVAKPLKRSVPIEIIYNFVDPEIFKPDARARQFSRSTHNISEEAVVIFCPRRLSIKCGVIYAVQAFDLIHRQMKNSLLVLVGKGVEKDNIERYLKTHDLEKDTLVLGDVSLDKMPALYNLSDYVVIPSIISEGMVEASSLSAIEAMACEKVVIASNVGGLREIIINNETGVLVPPEDPAAICEQIIAISRSPDRYNKLAKNARNYVKQELSANETARRFIRLYDIGSIRK
jgi:glycosyltransferase involved in cell wall biosynthesis